MDENNEDNEIIVSACCKICISTHDFIVRVLKPTIQELMENINMHIIQAGMTRRYKLNNIFIFGAFVEASRSIQKLIEKTTIDYLARSLGIDKKEDILFTNCNGNEVINGTAMYGLDPTIYTERVSRNTYKVSVVAYSSMNNTDNTLVDLHFQPERGSSRTLKVAHEENITLIHKHEPITTDMQSIGTFKRFFVGKDCIVYASK